MTIKEISVDHFYSDWINKKEHHPLRGCIELTYVCGFKCIHCYCYGLENKKKPKELTTQEWKNIFDEIQKEGSLYLTFTGGDPLTREDFLEIYAYAKMKGFLVTIFTNGQLLNEAILDYFMQSPPYSIEITLNGVTEDTYEAVTQISGSYRKVIENIKKLKEKGINLILKSNCLRQNKNEIAKIKAFTEKLLGKTSEHRYRFKYDPVIFPRLNGDKTPCDHRLSSEELLDVKRQDVDIWKEYQRGLQHNEFLDLERDRAFLYHCNSWMQNFFINPYGKLKFCELSDKFSANIRTTSFREWFYGLPEKILAEKFKTNSPCRDCNLRPICYFCPARSFLETGSEEGPVEYYCQLAKGMFAEMQKAKSETVKKEKNGPYQSKKTNSGNNI